MDERAMELLALYHRAVLAAYREQLDTFTRRPDHFEGSVRVTTEYFADLEDDAKEYVAKLTVGRVTSDGAPPLHPSTHGQRAGGPGLARSRHP